MDEAKNQSVQNISLEEKTREEIQQFIGIRLEKEIYGILIKKTREVAKPLQITNIPGTPPHIIGLMNLRGEILCVVDIKILLNMGKSILTEKNRVVVIKTKEGPVGVLCDEVLDIYDIVSRDIEAPLSTLSGEIGAYIQGQVQVSHALMGILDIEKLLFRQEK